MWTGVELQVYRNSSLLRTLDGSAFDGAYQLRFRAQNAFGVNVSEAAISIDNVQRAY